MKITLTIDTVVSGTITDDLVNDFVQGLLIGQTLTAGSGGAIEFDGKPENVRIEDVEDFDLYSLTEDERQAAEKLCKEIDCIYGRADGSYPCPDDDDFVL